MFLLFVEDRQALILIEFVYTVFQNPKHYADPLSQKLFGRLLSHQGFAMHFRIVEQ